MHQLDQFVMAVVACAREKGTVNIGVLRAALLSEGMDEEELTLLLDIVSIEVRHTQKAVTVPKSHTSF